MSKPATTRHRVALLGFSEFERSALASYFRLAAARTPQYELVQMLTDADHLVADADHAASVQLVVATDRLADTVFIGSQAPAGSTAWMSRPIDAMHVMRELDAMVALSHAGMRLQTTVQLPRRPLPVVEDVVPPPTTSPSTSTSPPLDLLLPADAPDLATTPAPAEPESPPIFVPDASAILLEPAYARFTPAVHLPRPVAVPALPAGVVAAPMTAAATAAVTAAATAADPAPSAAAPPALPATATAPRPRALLVDDSEIALRYLETRLERWGLQTDSAGSSGRALELLAAHSYALVFLDIELGSDSDMGGLELCQHIKHSTTELDTAVVLVSAHHSELDRVRGALAGCDAYLGKPLQAADLERLLLRHGLQRSEAAA